MNIHDKHQRLYNKIPTFECKPGCTDCCGPVPFSKWEWSRIKDKRNARGLNCPYAVNGRCDIYEQRPLMCRLYGAVETLQCPYGCGPINKLTDAQAKEILQEYMKLDKQTNRRTGKGNTARVHETDK